MRDGFKFNVKEIYKNESEERIKENVQKIVNELIKKDFENLVD